MSGNNEEEIKLRAFNEGYQQGVEEERGRDDAKVKRLREAIENVDRNWSVTGTEAGAAAAKVSQWCKEKILAAFDQALGEEVC